jgi:hypothetical protein
LSIKQIFGEFSLKKIENEGTLTTVKQSPCWETGFSIKILKQILFIPEFHKASRIDWKWINSGVDSPKDTSHGFLVV